MILISRIYPAEAYGSWIIILSLATFVMPLATLRYDLAIVLAPTRRMGIAISVAILCQAVILSFLCLLAIRFFSPSTLITLSGIDPQQVSFLNLVPIVTLLMVANTVFQAWCSRQKDFWSIATSITTQSVVTAALTLAFPLVFTASTTGAAMAAILGIFAALAVLIYRSRSSISEALKIKHLLQAAWHGVRRFKVYAILGVPYAISSVMTERALQLLIASSFGVGTLASYFVVKQIIFGPTAIITGSLRQAVFAFGAQQDSQEHLRKRVLTILTLLSGLVGPTLAFTMVWIKPLITTFMSTKWPYFAEFSVWMLYPSAMLVLTGWIDRVLDIFGKQRMSLWLQIVADIVFVGGALLSIMAGFSAVNFIALLSVLIGSYNIIWLIVALNLLRTTTTERMKLYGHFAVSFGLSIACQQANVWLLPTKMALVSSIFIALISLLPTISLVSRIRTQGI